MSSPRLLSACLLTAALLCPAFRAGAWEATLSDEPSLPRALVAVDKSGNKLFYLEKHSPLLLRHAYPSIHGQAEGDKQSEGDLRTPEGVYFVTGRVRAPLDFEEYGSQAHALNYPNPVDRLRGKTGSGIWIHSKGSPIATQTTKGCIAIDLDNIAALEPDLTPGTPVVVAESIISDAIPSSKGANGDKAGGETPSGTPATAAITRLLTEKTKEWNHAWASRSAAMFDFYDADAYTRAQGEDFQAFRAQKEQLFRRLPWISIQYGDISVLQGPGYWVSWFKQYYRAPNLRTEGIRRLYWQPSKGGELKIVGMEWLPQDLGMERAYLDSLAPGVAAFVETWRKAWQKADLEKYMAFYDRDAVQDSRRGSEAIRAHKQQTWAKRTPVAVDLYGIRVRLEDQGVRVDMTQVYRDSSGYRDKGVKELLLYPDGDSWRIRTETWSAQ